MATWCLPAATGAKPLADPLLRPGRARHAGGQRHGARDRPRRLRGDGAAVSRARCRAGRTSSERRPRTETAPRGTAPDRCKACPVIMSASRRPVAGPSVSPQCACPIASHRPACPGARPITGRESGKHGRLPIQVLSSARSPSGNNARARGISAVELHRRRRRIARGKLGAGGEADALLHRRDQVAVIDIDHRPRQCRIAVARGNAGDSRA